MVSSLEEAMSLLSKWKAERTRLRCVFATHSSGLDFVGRVNEVIGNKVQISYEELVLITDLAGAKSFKYCELRETQSASWPAAEREYTSALEIRFKSGDELILYEFRLE
jgi:hypothetical protein